VHARGGQPAARGGRAPAPQLAARVAAPQRRRSGCASATLGCVAHALASLAELKEFWKAYDAAAETNAGLGVGAAAPASDKEDKPAAEGADKAADALADSLGSVKVADKEATAA
jgi:hypothetical protein